MSTRWQQYFPFGSLDPRHDLHEFQAKWYSGALERLGEQPLYQGDHGRPFVIRFLCLPTWSSACSIRVEPSGLNWRLVVKELDGKEAGFDLGELCRHDDRLIVGTAASRMSEMWNYLHFWSLAFAEEESCVLDGTANVLEAVEGNNYHVVVRDEWEWGDTFGEFTDLLFELADLAPR